MSSLLFQGRRSLLHRSPCLTSRALSYFSGTQDYSRYIYRIIGLLFIRYYIQLVYLLFTATIDVLWMSILPGVAFQSPGLRALKEGMVGV